MNKKDLIEKVVGVLQENNVRKNVASQKTILHISDDYGNASDFVVKKADSGLLFTNKDVSAIVDAILAVVEDSLKRGEEVSIHGFGSLGIHQRAARQTVHPATGEPVEVDARYVPKFNFGNALRMAAKLYELSLEDKRGCS